ncbi:MAG: hypothetical protein IPP07_23095 [Holophagales bacterium]|jgi:hypothetical protein|nr:hypothetical protein [Holophagales bacterium]
MKVRLLAGLVLAGLTLPAEGVPPVSMRARVIVEGVAPGTRLTAEMRADYVVYDISRGLGRAGELPEVFRMKGAGALRVDLVVPASGRARPAGARIRFERPLDPVPPGMAALVELPVQYSIECGGASPGCRPRDGNPSFSLRAPSKAGEALSPCLQFRAGPSSRDVFVGVGAGCDDPRKGSSPVARR